MVENLEDRLAHLGVIEVQVRLVAVEAMPVVCPGHGVPRPIGRFKVFEDDSGVLVLLRRVAPYVIVAVAAVGLGTPRPLKPRMLIRGVVNHQFSDHFQAPAVRTAEKHLEILQCSVAGMDPRVVGDVVAVVAHRRRIEGQQPKRGDAEVLQVVKFLRQTAKIPHAVAAGIAKRAHVQLIDDRILVPLSVGFRHCRLFPLTCQPRT